MRLVICVQFLLLLALGPVYGQNLSLEKIIDLVNKDEAEINSQLENEGWEMAETTELNGARTVLWAYNKCASCQDGFCFVYPDAWSYRKTKYKAKMWIVMIDMNVKDKNHMLRNVEVYTTDKKYFLQLRNEATNLGYKNDRYHNNYGVISYRFAKDKRLIFFTGFTSGPKAGQSCVGVRKCN